jgi:catechol 2,3-dioxygenase-like lactoylglutathione lyase family enzyme
MSRTEEDMAGIEKVSTLTIAVRDQQEALRWFTDKLEFQIRSDLAAPGMRWLTIAPKKQTEIEFVLAAWFPELVGKNAPCVLETQDCRGTYQTLVSRGVIFKQQPTDKPYGVEAVFEDLYGNTYALVERPKPR